jgi:hypothetical protein
MLLLCLIYVRYVFGLGGINITKPKCFNKQRIVYMCVCVCVCVYVYVYLCVCVCVCDYLLCVGMHYKIKLYCTWNHGNIMSNVSDYISPIRLRSIAGDLAGLLVRVSGWGKTSDSKYNFLIISYFKFKNCTYQNGCFKGEETHGLQKILWSLLITPIYTMVCRV